jgi:HB1, ASXL, restriction endonuclease HTH domain
VLATARDASNPAGSTRAPRRPRETSLAGAESLVAVARPHRTDEEKEAITMAKQTSAKRVSAKQVAIDVLRAADEPLKAKEVAKRVIDSGRCSGLKGKTPEATISAMLAVGSKLGGPFKRVDKGTYTLAETTSATGTPTVQAKPAAAKKRAQARKPPQAQTSKGRSTKPKPTRSR